jgi:midasin
MNNATDTMDILGSFEQIACRRQILELLRDVLSFLDSLARSANYLHVHEIVEYRVLEKSIALQLASDDLRSLLSTAYTLVRGLDGLLDIFSQERSDLITRMHVLTDTLDVAGRFEWVDGPLVRALKQGHWLLLDGANLCNPSVLDRLNSLCESGGVLTLSENGHVDGEVQIINPHPNFRLFMTVDPHRGELSRAMRNRGVEIALIDPETPEDRYVIMEHHRLPFCDTFSSVGSFARFEMWRRGLLTGALPTKPATVTSASALLIQDCACKSLVDYFEPLSSSLVPKSEDALLFFAVQSVPPGYLAYFVRFIHTLSSFDNRSIISRITSILRSLPGDSISSIFSQLREKSSRMWGIPVEFLSLQVSDSL